MKFSIITVCRNSSLTIRKTFDMMLAQQCKDYEYIVVDGASTDGTLDIIKSYVDRFEGRMRYVSEVDTGIYNAMNKGVRMSKGEWIAFNNSNDWYEPNALKIISDEIDKHVSIDEPAVIHGMNRNYDEKGTNILYTEGVSYLMLPQRMMPHPSAFVNRLAWDKIGMFDETYKILADYELFLRLYYAKVKFYYVEKVVSNFTLGGACCSDNTIFDTIKIKRKYGLMSNFEYWLKYAYHKILK